MIENFGRNLTKKQIDMLRVMRDGQEDLVFEGERGFIGNHSIGPRMFHSLLRACAISSTGGVYYEINGTGLQILEQRERLTIARDADPEVKP